MIPSAQVYKKVSLTISPLSRENKVITEEEVSSNLLYFQNIVCPRNTKPKKNGITPRRNMIKLFHDLERVAVMMFRLLVYSRYLKIVIHASITPKPIRTSLCSKINKLAAMASSSVATRAPKSWKKLPATITINQKSKNFILSKNPKSYQFFLQSTVARSCFAFPALCRFCSREISLWLTFFL